MFFFHVGKSLLKRESNIAYISAFIGNTLAILLTMVTAFSLLYKQYGIQVSSNLPPIKAMGTCFYFSVITWTTVGYGDYSPTVGGQKIAALEAAIGHIVEGIALATLIYLVGLLTRTTRRRRNVVLRRPSESPRGKPDISSVD